MIASAKFWRLAPLDELNWFVNAAQSATETRHD